VRSRETGGTGLGLSIATGRAARRRVRVETGTGRPVTVRSRKEWLLVGAGGALGSMAR
jgi:hypothetical protein